MIKMICDRCRKEIEGTTYYTIRIHADDINSKQDGTIALATALQNLETNTSVLFNAKKQYCKKCKEDIEAFIGKKE